MIKIRIAILKSKNSRIAEKKQRVKKEIIKESMDIPSFCLLSPYLISLNQADSMSIALISTSTKLIGIEVRSQGLRRV